jgi:hypothetical protein
LPQEHGYDARFNQAGFTRSRLVSDLAETVVAGFRLLSRLEETAARGFRPSPAILAGTAATDFRPQRRESSVETVVAGFRQLSRLAETAAKGFHQQRAEGVLSVGSNISGRPT